jgi:hypothetical protein
MHARRSGGCVGIYCEWHGWFLLDVWIPSDFPVDRPQRSGKTGDGIILISFELG